MTTELRTGATSLSINKTDGSKMLMMSQNGRYELRYYGTDKELRILDTISGGTVLWKNSTPDISSSSQVYLKLDATSNELKLCTSSTCGNTVTLVIANYPGLSGSTLTLKINNDTGMLELWEGLTNKWTSVRIGSGTPAQPSSPATAAPTEKKVVQVATDLQKIEDTMLNRNTLMYSILGIILFITLILFSILMFTTLKNERMGVASLLAINGIALAVCVIMLVARGMNKSMSEFGMLKFDNLTCSIDKKYDSGGCTNAWPS